jgi:hypothetical protein
VQRETPLAAEGVIVWQNKKVRSLVVVVSPHLSLPLTLSLSLSFVLCGWLLAGSRLLNGTDESKDCQEVWVWTFVRWASWAVGGVGLGLDHPWVGWAAWAGAAVPGAAVGAGRPCRGRWRLQEDLAVVGIGRG